jgi:hypothetical protein
MKIIICSVAALSISLCSNMQAGFAGGLGAGGLGTSSGSGMGGGMGERPRKTQVKTKQKGDVPVKIPQDNPLVNSPSPPPPSASMLTKVGWCEVQVFGHTFSDPGLLGASLVAVHMHLPDRLDHLNHQIHFDPRKSGTKLMDEVDELVKFVDTHRQPKNPDAPAAQTAAEQRE